MKTIQRNIPPDCLTKQSNNQPWSDFARTSCHTETRNILIQEQCGLCCYCESLVNSGDGHIEHLEPRKKNQKRTYDYTNLAISCNGGNGQHCGHFKDAPHNHDFAWDPKKFSYPHNSETASFFRYLPDGSINPTSINQEKSLFLIGYLGLNCPSLQERRRSHASRLIDALTEQPDVETRNFLCEYYLKPDTDNYLQSFYSLSKAILEP